MPISTLQTVERRSGKPKYSNILIFLTAILIVLLLVFFGKTLFTKLKNIGGKSAITVDVAYGRADVFVDEENLGVTPVESAEIKPGENKVTLRSSNRIYETTIKFLSNNDKYIHNVEILRDLGVSDLFSAGQDTWFDESTSEVVLRIISDPPGASVYIDGTEIGKTPYTSSKLTEGDYDIKVESIGYEPQKTRIRVQKGYTSNISVKLFPMPVPSRVIQFEGSDGLFDVASDNNEIVSDTETWVKAVIYWNQTRGINIEGVGMNKELIFDYYVDYKGSVFDARGEMVMDPENFEGFESVEKGAYLGRRSDGPGLTEMAKEGLSKVKAIPQIDDSETKVRILPTGLGWLRVRSQPSTGSTEVAKVDVGAEYVLLEDGVEWIRIKVSDTVEGWVSKGYTETVVAEVATGVLGEERVAPVEEVIPEETIVTDGSAESI